MEQSMEQYAVKTIFAIICVALLMIVGGVVFFRSFYSVAFALGVVMTSILNVGKVLWLKHTVKRASTMQSSLVGGYTGAFYLARFIATGLVLVLAFYLPHVDLFGAAIGLLTLPIAGYAIGFTSKRHIGQYTQAQEATPEDINEAN